MEAAKSSNGSLVSSRGDARISIAKKWADRRKLQESQQRGEQRSDNFHGDTSDMSAMERNSRPPLSTDHGIFSIPPLCVLLRRSWNQTINSLIQQHPKKDHSYSNDYKTQTAGRGSSSSQEQNSASNHLRSAAACTKHDNNNNKRIPFPSVLSVLKANAVKLQVETIMMAEENESGLSVLPANCNDFTTSAVNHMSNSRSRAFLLIDFSAIVQTHTVWRKRLAIPQVHKDVQIVYSARHNCNARLLQLLQRMGVGLRVATKYDLAAVREATRDNHDRDSAIIWDDPSVLVKPNSFYRNLLLNRSPKEDEDLGTTATTTTRTIPITVSDAEEMERIHKQLHKICKRRRQRQSNIPKLEFLLKLDNTTDAFKHWKKVLRNMHEKAMELSLTEVVGVSLELGGEDEASTNSSDRGVATTQKKDCISLLGALSDLIENWNDELMMAGKTGANTTTIATQSTHQLPQVHLTNPIAATEIGNGAIEWIEKHRKLCNGITIDASRVLMANAAALCTRIIGVKKNESNPGKRGDNSHKSNMVLDNINSEKVDDGNDSSSGGTDLTDDGVHQEEDEANAIQQHLYIDDGCYGSLSNYPNEGMPLPLKSQRLARSLSAPNKQHFEREQETLVNTTVWGPTCK